jgi:Ribbon-helix-helix protein, copG family
MSTARVYWGGRPRTQGAQEDPLVTVSLHVRKSQMAALDQLADAAHTSQAALVREPIDRLLTHLKGLLTRLKRPSSWRTGGTSATRSTPRHDPRRLPARLEAGDAAQPSKEMP